VIIQDALTDFRVQGLPRRPSAQSLRGQSVYELGLATAYVRVGKRHAGEPFAPHPDLRLDLLPVPPFQICSIYALSR
jgi:hypothetical protein